MADVKLTLDEIYDLAFKALLGAGVSPENAGPVALSLRDAEADGVTAVGISYLVFYIAHLEGGRVDGKARPKLVQKAPSALHVDAASGFAHPAYMIGEEALLAAARETGIAGLSVGNSYLNGVLGFFVRRIAEAGLIGLTFTNASPSVAPAGAAKPFFGTNPLAFGAPRKNGPPIVVDQATSQTALINVKRAAERGQQVPDTWGVDGAGKPTGDPQTILANALAPMAGYKGTGLGLMVEVLAGGLAGAKWSPEVLPLGEKKGPPPGIGQFYLAIDPARFGGERFLDRIEDLIAAFLKIEGAHLPGDTRHAVREKTAREGVTISRTLFDQLSVYAAKAI